MVGIHDHLSGGIGHQILKSLCVQCTAEQGAGQHESTRTCAGPCTICMVHTHCTSKMSEALQGRKDEVSDTFACNGNMLQLAHFCATSVCAGAGRR